MTKNILVLSLALMLAVSPGLVLADSAAQVSINDINVGCGEQEMSFSGTAQFDQILDHLQVLLDGVQIHHQDGMSTESADSWTTDSVTVSTGEHTLTAIVWDQEDGDDGFRGEEARTTVNLTVAACSTGGGGEDVGDQGPGGDCCPGPDPIVSPVGGGKVKGISIAGLPGRLKPLNAIFRSVYGRNPTYAEWKYWANRLLTDKPQHEALYGAMQWHQLLGHTVGK